MILPSKIRFADERLKKAFAELQFSKTEDKKLFKFLTRAFVDIEKNAFCGIQIPKHLMPKEYLKKTNFNSYWKYDLPNAWRLIYIVGKEEVIVVSIVLEWMNHKEYGRKFRYTSK